MKNQETAQAKVSTQFIQSHLEPFQLGRCLFRFRKGLAFFFFLLSCNLIGCGGGDEGALISTLKPRFSPPGQAATPDEDGKGDEGTTENPEDAASTPEDAASTVGSEDLPGGGGDGLGSEGLASAPSGTTPRGGQSLFAWLRSGFSWFLGRPSDSSVLPESGPGTVDSGSQNGAGEGSVPTNSFRTQTQKTPKEWLELSSRLQGNNLEKFIYPLLKSHDPQCRTFVRKSEIEKNQELHHTLCSLFDQSMQSLPNQQALRSQLFFHHVQRQKQATGAIPLCEALKGGLCALESVDQAHYQKIWKDISSGWTEVEVACKAYIRALENETPQVQGSQSQRSVTIPNEIMSSLRCSLLVQAMVEKNSETQIELWKKATSLFHFPSSVQTATINSSKAFDLSDSGSGDSSLFVQFTFNNSATQAQENSTEKQRRIDFDEALFDFVTLVLFWNSGDLSSYHPKIGLDEAKRAAEDLARLAHLAEKPGHRVYYDDLAKEKKQLVEAALAFQKHALTPAIHWDIGATSWGERSQRHVGNVIDSIRFLLLLESFTGCFLKLCAFQVPTIKTYIGNFDLVGPVILTLTSFLVEDQVRPDLLLITGLQLGSYLSQSSIQSFFSNLAKQVAPGGTCEPCSWGYKLVRTGQNLMSGVVKSVVPGVTGLCFTLAKATIPPLGKGLSSLVSCSVVKVLGAVNGDASQGEWKGLVSKNSVPDPNVLGSVSGHSSVNKSKFVFLAVLFDRASMIKSRTIREGIELGKRKVNQVYQSNKIKLAQIILKQAGIPLPQKTIQTGFQISYFFDCIAQFLQSSNNLNETLENALCRLKIEEKGTTQSEQDAKQKKLKEAICIGIKNDTNDLFDLATQLEEPLNDLIAKGAIKKLTIETMGFLSGTITGFPRVCHFASTAVYNYVMFCHTMVQGARKVSFVLSDAKRFFCCRKADPKGGQEAGDDQEDE